VVTFNYPRRNKVLMNFKKTSAIVTLLVSTFVINSTSVAAEEPHHNSHQLTDTVHYEYANVDGLKIFYREAGNPSSPTILLLHGFPTSSHMYRDLIPLLADKYHVIAPDLPGFGFSDAPDRTKYKYTFENLAKTMDRFTEVIGQKQFAIQVFDYGAPTGYRMALNHPERITAIITQNGNAYEAGLGDAWDPIKKYWKNPTLKNREALRQFLKPEGLAWQYTFGVSDTSLIAPETYTLDSAWMAKGENEEIQLDLFLDYANNVALYPKFQEYFRQYTPPLLAVWGKNDPFFIPAGAEAHKKDLPNAEVHIYDAGHFALESNLPEISAEIRKFLAKNLKN
jgi:pimeloyl-ACP methyl ester carboxylesterase